MKNMRKIIDRTYGAIGWNVLRTVFILSFFHSFILLVSCSEDESAAEEFDNWQERNDAATAQWAANSSLRKIRVYTQNEGAPGSNSDYIYVEELTSGLEKGSESPISTDTACVAYRGRLIPSATYSQGYVFDQSYIGDFNPATMGTATFKVGGTRPGFATALQNMKKGERWRVYVPYAQMYGSTSDTGFPAYSNMIFDIVLVDFWHPGEKHPAFKAKKTDN